MQPWTHLLADDGTPNNSPLSAAVGAGRSAGTVPAARRRWFSFPYMRDALFVLSLFLLTAISRASTIQTLETPSYKITIEKRCPEGYVTCEDVKYVGVSKKTGKSITLVGKTVHTFGPDSVTPAHFLGYEFNNGSTTYFVSDDGEIVVKRGKKILVQETGVWKP